MLLIVGLGNPGTAYMGHRHNIGFMAVDALASAHGFSPWRQRFQGEMAEGRLGADKAVALKPMTFMNESGRAVGEALRFFRLTPADLVVLHDELDLEPGRVRAKKGGGHAGHNGLRSIDAHIGPDYRRIRLGIGHPGDRHKVAGYVLHDFAKADQDWLTALLGAVAAEAPKLAQTPAGTGDAAFARAVGDAVHPPPPPRPKPPPKPVRTTPSDPVPPDPVPPDPTNKPTPGSMSGDGSGT